ncbi:MAG: class I SAM-dependent methyltransferase [Bryobacterales bacterium]|nr:class I SAM-dependent methyltransferase [Bryobacterales bacterium]
MLSPSVSEAVITRPEMLEQCIGRTSPGTDPCVFIQQVQKAYHQAQRALRTVAPDTVPAKGAQCASHADYLGAMWTARSARRALVVGGGAGVPSQPASYAAGQWASVHGTGDVVRLDLVSGAPFEAQLMVRKPFDVVITYSLAHHLANLPEFFRFIDKHTSPGGFFVFGHEPNARFWRNLSCVNAMLQLRSERSKSSARLRYLRPSAHFTKVRQWLGAYQAPLSITEAANEVLRIEFGFIGPLQELDFVRLVDLHRPQEAEGWQCLGLTGFDVKSILETYLPGFREVWRSTACHVGYRPRLLLSPAWRKVDLDLARRYPDDGATMSVCLQKR